MTRTARRTWDRLLELLVAVRLGQELGTHSELAQCVANAVDFLVHTAGKILH